MQKLKRLLRIALLVLVAVWLAPLFGAGESSALYAPPAEFLIKFRTGQPAASFLASYGLTAVGHIPRIDVWLATQPAGAPGLTVNDLAGRAEVAWVEPNGRVRASEQIPNDTFYQARQQHLVLMRLPQAWTMTTGDSLPIAVVDTGVDLDHPDLAMKVWVNQGEIPANGVDDDGNGYVDDVNGWNWIAASNQPQDDQGHGSHVAGIAAASSNNAIGIAGMSWGASIMPLKALNSKGVGTWADVAEAVIYAADNGARIINLSLGDEQSSQTIQAAVDYARGRGSLLIAAAGNCSPSYLVDYPARLPGVMAIAATTAQDARWSCSNYGPEIDVSAPGENILSTGQAGNYFGLSGTSMATAHVSGLAALVWSVRTDLSSDQVTRIITETARDIASPGWDAYTGWGRIDAYAAVLAARPKWFLPIILR